MEMRYYIYILQCLLEEFITKHRFNKFIRMIFDDDYLMELSLIEYANDYDAKYVVMPDGSKYVVHEVGYSSTRSYKVCDIGYSMHPNMTYVNNKSATCLGDSCRFNNCPWKWDDDYIVLKSTTSYLLSINRRSRMNLLVSSLMKVKLRDEGK